MRRFLIGAVLALMLAAPSLAQSPILVQPDHPMETLLSARATLIQRYVQSAKTARGVSVCGETDLLTGEDHSYLCVYVYRDSLKPFLADFLNFATETTPGGSYGVGGVPVSIEILEPPMVPPPPPDSPNLKRA